MARGKCMVVGAPGTLQIMSVVDRNMNNAHLQIETVQRDSSFYSILFHDAESVRNLDEQLPPEFFKDLNLDQVVAAVTGPWKDYNLAPFFFVPLNDLEAIRYRQEIIRDFEDSRVLQAIQSFSDDMRAMREGLKQAKDLYYKYATERGFLGAVEIYYHAVERLALDLDALEIQSGGLRMFREYLAEYVATAGFRQLVAEGEKLKQDLSTVRYCLLIRGDTVTVRLYAEEEDYSVTVEDTVAKFRRDTQKSYQIRVPKHDGMNHIQAQVLEGVALLYPETFHGLTEFSSTHADYLDETVSRFDREIQFYVAYLKYIEGFKTAGLSFCLPTLSKTTKEICGRDAFDIVLAGKIRSAKGEVVCNDFFLRSPERILVVSGPNQGGKTTFARMFGQLHYLASLGCPVPGTEAHLFLSDRIFTHFEREEEMSTLRGKLHDDLVRIHQILEQATPNSIVIMNEMFSSTSLKDAIFLSKRVMSTITAHDLIGVWVTFLDELASFNEKTVSMVSTVDPHDPSIRTFKLKRQPADGLAYAHAIAEKHRVTYKWLMERIRT